MSDHQSYYLGGIFLRMPFIVFSKLIVKLRLSLSSLLLFND